MPQRPTLVSVPYSCFKNSRLHAPSPSASAWNAHPCGNALCLPVCPTAARTPIRPPNAESSPTLSVLPSLPAPPVSAPALRPRHRARCPRSPSLLERLCSPFCPPLSAPSEPRRTLGGGPAAAVPASLPATRQWGAAPPAPPALRGSAAPRTPRRSTGAGPARGGRVASHRSGDPEHRAVRRGTGMAAGQRRGMAAPPLALALGLLAIAQVRWPAARPPASPWASAGLLRSNGAARAPHLWLRECPRARGAPSRSAAGLLLGRQVAARLPKAPCPKPLSAPAAGGRLCCVLGLPGGHHREPASGESRRSLEGGVGGSLL
ncbi:putative HTLV-1-related endogenous sequence [Manacus candei]|uniref:putative HTLV-1-related endogenous sequence n=1 Tax=Manacus candei TaxID=415023 RepID=UPI002225DF70|nr:putative HTLV-1-related endogenous sequence [Manacus candei]